MIEPNDRISPTQSGPVHRSISIVAVSIFNLLIGCLLLLFCVTTLIGVLGYHPNPDGINPDGTVQFMGAVVAVIALPFIVLCFFTAYGVWQMRSWGLQLAITLGIIYLLISLPSLYGILTSPASGGLFTVSGGLTLLVLIAGIIQVSFLFRPGLRN